MVQASSKIQHQLKSFTENASTSDAKSRESQSPIFRKSPKDFGLSFPSCKFPQPSCRKHRPRARAHSHLKDSKISRICIPFSTIFLGQKSQKVLDESMTD